MDLARLKAVVTPHAGDWLHAPPLTAVGLRLSDAAIRVAIGYRLGTNTCQPHTCVCGATVDARGLHEFRQAKNPSNYWGLTVKGPTERHWSRGLVAHRLLGMWQSPIRTRRHTSTDFNDSLRSSRKVSVNKTTQYVSLAATHSFVPVVIETGGSWYPQSAEFIGSLRLPTSRSRQHICTRGCR